MTYDTHNTSNIKRERTVRPTQQSIEIRPAGGVVEITRGEKVCIQKLDTSPSVLSLEDHVTNWDNLNLVSKEKNPTYLKARQTVLIILSSRGCDAANGISACRNTNAAGGNPILVGGK